MPAVGELVRRTIVAIAVVATMLSVVSCGDEDSSVSKTPDGEECTNITNPAATVSVAVNLIVRLRDAASWENYSEESVRPAETLAAIEKLRELEEYDTDDALTEALDTYEKAVQLTKTAASTPSPADSAEGKALAELTADMATFLGYQKALVDARTAAGC